MPWDSLLVAVGVGVVFSLFAVVLAWADHSTTSWTRSRSQSDQPAKSTDTSHLKKVA
jgi:hypothetical protein